MNMFKTFKSFKKFNPSFGPPPASAGEEGSPRFERLRPPKRFELSEAIELLERFEHERRQEREMPYKDPDPSDPNVLVGVMLPAEKETMRDMAYAFAEEFALLGYDRDGLFRVFQNPFYAGAHQAYRALGEEAVRKIIAECLAAWGGVKFSILDFGFSIEEQKGEIQNSPSPIKNPKSKIQNGGERGGSDA